VRPNEISYNIIGAAMRVHTDLGPGLLEGAYEKALCHEFTRSRLHFRRQVPMPIQYAGAHISPAYRIDFIVEHVVVVEIKSVDSLLPVHRTQLLSYLRLSGLPLGLLLNFRVAHLRDGIARLINASESDL
jgi:GxxExxY protein